MAWHKLVSGIVLSALASLAAAAGPAPFDLAGPVLDVTVTRSGHTLPIAQVPNLAAGDKLKVRAELPSTQSVDYLLVVAFLSGSTNPPPEKWFFPCKTWKGKCEKEGLSVTVPEGAQQVILFLAPATTGDFDALVDAVRGRPGAFVRSSQDLNQAALDRVRLQRYLNTVQTLDKSDPAGLKIVAPLLARSLAIRVDEKCLDRAPALQAPCLMSGQESLILADGHSRSIVEALAASPGTDLLLQVSSTPEGGYGYYSPYILSVIDIARILDSFTTARYQFIPALASASGSKLALTLNTAPSFQSPRSVLVAALPAVDAPLLPPLRSVEPDAIYCASQSNLVLPVEGAPLVFATEFAHDLKLVVTTGDGKTIELPARADGTQGGYVIDTAALRGQPLGGEALRAVLKGHWGFTPYTGPGFQLRNAQARQWTLAPGAESALVVGRTDTVHLRADSVACIDRILAKDPAGKELRAEWKPLKPGEVELRLPLQDASPGPLTLFISQHGSAQPDTIAVQTFAEVARLDSLVLHAGDAQAQLSGSRLDEVRGLVAGDIAFKPGTLSTEQAKDRLSLFTDNAEAVRALREGQRLNATATLADGRRIDTTLTVLAARPRIELIGRQVRAAVETGAIALEADEMSPADALTFSMRTLAPASWSREQTLEIATADEVVAATLSQSNGGIRLENARVAVASFEPQKSLSASAFGKLLVRSVVKGIAGDWQPLVTLVRLPGVQALRCPAAAEAEAACMLAGRDLFLIEAVAASAGFERAVAVPEGYTQPSLAVPRPQAEGLSLRLRDRPEVIRKLRLPVEQAGAAAP